MNVKALWVGIRAAAAELDPDTPPDSLEYSQKEIWLVSVASENAGGTIAGRVFSATPMTAARMLKEQTHVLASAEQIAAHKKDLAQRRETILREEAEHKQSIQVVITPELVEKAARSSKAGPRNTGAEN